MKRIKREHVRPLLPDFLKARSGPRPKRRHGGGHPPHVPNKKTRLRVRDLSAVGYSINAISKCLGITSNTLYKYYRKELQYATMVMLAACRGALAKAIRAKEPWAIKFTLDRKGKDLGWGQRAEVTGKDGSPLFDLSKLTDQELAMLEKMQTKAGPGV